MSYFIMLANEFDLESIISLNRSSNPHPWSDKMISDSLSSRPSWVLHHDNNEADIAGWLLASSVCDQSELELVIVDKAQRRKGYAEALLANWKNWAQENKHQELLLEVRESNLAAINLYIKMGFKEVGRRKNYYPTNSGREAACLMSLTICSTVSHSN